MSPRSKLSRDTRSTSSRAPVDFTEVSSVLDLARNHAGHLRVAYWKVDVAPIVLGVLAFVLVMVVLAMAVVLPADFWPKHAGAMEVAGKVAAELLVR